MRFKDYYEVMGVARGATQDEIKRAYRKLARKFHPDVSKETQAEDRFKELQEAYEVLKDPEKRAAYDQLGANWRQGQEFRPPPDWGKGFEFSPGPGRGRAAAWAGAGRRFQRLFLGALRFAQSVRRHRAGSKRAVGRGRRVCRRRAGPRRACRDRPRGRLQGRHAHDRPARARAFARWPRHGEASHVAGRDPGGRRRRASRSGWRGRAVPVSVADPPVTSSWK